MAAAGLLAATGCSTFETDDPLTVMERSDMAALRINVYTPSEMSTRAEDTEAALTAERQIHSIRVYAYLNESECTQQLIDEHQLSVNVDQLKQRCVGYAILSSTDGLMVNDDLEYTWVEMGLPRYTINKKLDFYAMANMEGTGFESVAALDYYPTRTAVENCSFTAFGTTNAVSKQVPETGLPASRILKGLTPVTSLEGNNRLSITLLRAVGKVRFFFAKPQGLTGAQLTAIKLNVNKAGNLTDAQKLPTSAKTMPIADETLDGFKVSLHNNGVALPTGVTRDAGQISYTNFDGLNDDTNGIKAVDDPEVFTKGGKADAPITENFSQYIDRLEANTTEFVDGLTYIRESDNKIYGTVSYKLNAAEEEKTADFELYTADTETHAQPCFPRNHYSVVYGYFKGGKLEIKPVVLPWDYNAATDNNEYTTKGGSSLRVLDQANPNYFRYKICTGEGVAQQPSSINWNDAWAAIAYDPEFGNGGGENNPNYNTLLQLTVSHDNETRMVLQSSNGHFGFVYRLPKNDPNARDSYSEIQDELEINETTGEYDESAGTYTTTFYVVPKQTSAEGDKTEISLVAISGGTVSRMPYNSSILPGSNDNTASYFYRVSSTTWNNISYYTQRY